MRSVPSFFIFFFMSKIGIVGGGIIGATIAYELSKIKNLKITLYETNRTIEGATSAALGVLVGISSHKKSGRAWQLRQESITAYPGLIAQLEHLTGSPIAHNSQGLIHLCFDSDSLAKWQQLQGYRKNWTLDIWNPSELSRKCPEIANADIIAAIYSPSDWQINPKELTRALWKASSLNQVDLRLGQNVSKIIESQNKQSCLGVIVNGEFEPLDYLVIAAGLRSQKLTDKIQLQPVLGQAVHLQLKEYKYRDFHPVVTGKDVHIVPQSSGEYWVGATVEYGQSNPELLQGVLETAVSFCPILAQSSILSSWIGERPRPEGMYAPVIKKISENIILATGHYRNGVLLAPATALRVKEMILNDSEYPLG